MRNSKLNIVVCISVMVMVSMACSLSGFVSGLSNNNSGGTVTDLWPDVPKMDGIAQIQQDMPLEVKLAVQTFFAAASDNQGSINFIAYSTDKTPAEVVAYYDAARMKAAGWDSTDQPGCVSDTSNTSSQGALCLYGKQSGNNAGTLLAIIPNIDTTTKKTNIFFARIDVKNVATPTP